MSEQEHFFLFFSFYRKYEVIKESYHKINYASNFHARKVSMKWLNPLGEHCKRISVDFDPLEKDEVFLVLVYSNRTDKDITYENDCDHVSGFATKQEAEEYYNYITKGGHKEVLGKNESFVSAECIVLPIDKN